MNNFLHSARLLCQPVVYKDNMKPNICVDQCQSVVEEKAGSSGMLFGKDTAGA
jgi:hypothetical protein